MRRRWLSGRGVGWGVDAEAVDMGSVLSDIGSFLHVAFLDLSEGTKPVPIFNI